MPEEFEFEPGKVKREPEEERVEDVEKAFEMAKTEDLYRTLAAGARKAGLEDIAQHWETVAKEKAKEAGEAWERRKKEIEENIKSIISRIMKDREEILESERIGKEISSAEMHISPEPDLVFKLEQILGAETMPFSRKVITEPRYVGWREELYRTAIERVIVVKNLDSENDLRSCRVRILNNQAWSRLVETWSKKGEVKEE